MRIDRVRIVPFAIPYAHGGVTTSLGEDPVMRNVLLELHTDEGVAGWGETAPLPAYGGETLETVVAITKNNLAPLLIGHDPRNVRSLLLQMDRLLWGQPFAKCMVDGALHDLVARALGVPLYQLFGGMCRSTIPLAWTIGWKSPSEVAEETCQALERGFRAIKLKIGQPNVADDLERIEFVSRQLPTGVRLRLDANQGYSVSEAKGLLRALQGAEIQLLEQPVARWNLQAMKELRRHTAIPLLADEAVFDSHDVARLAFEQCADAVNIKPQKLGGLRKSMQCVEVAAAVGLGIFPSSRICTSVGVSACTHFYASLDRIDYEGEFADGLLVCAADVCTERVVIMDGAVVVPGGEGIGVDIDDMKLARVSLGDIVLH